MSISIGSIANRGEARRERIVMRVTSDTDVGAFIMLRAYFDGHNVTNGVSHIYWFPNKVVRRGDLVVLYSKRGVDTERPRKDSPGTVHFFYWGYGDSERLWNDTKHSAVLLRTDLIDLRNPQ